MAADSLVFTVSFPNQIRPGRHIQFSPGLDWGGKDLHQNAAGAAAGAAVVLVSLICSSGRPCGCSRPALKLWCSSLSIHNGSSGSRLVRATSGHIDQHIPVAPVPGPPPIRCRLHILAKGVLHAPPQRRLPQSADPLLTLLYRGRLCEGSWHVQSLRTEGLLHAPP